MTETRRPSPDERFQELLRELFQLDLADLDFGLYRLFRVKAAEIEAFIEVDIPSLVETAFQSVDQEGADRARAEHAAATTEVLDNLSPEAILPDGRLDEQFTSSPARLVRLLVSRYERARAAVDAITATVHQKASVYNHLHAFFSRYYEDGDFIPRRRSGQAEEYVVPYRGEEVLFHWPTRGMHYVKTGEHFRDYRVAVDGVLGGPYAIRFQLTEATVPRDNAKGDRRYFFPRPEALEYCTDAKLVTIPFEYRPPTAQETEQHGKRNGVQRSILEAAHDALVQAMAAHVAFLAPAMSVRDDEDSPTWLLRRLLHFTRRQTTDYFVFPGLKDFLERELEFYLKDVVLSLEDVRGDLASKLRSIAVIRQVGGRIVEFLDQIEQVQARLFEKRKLVLRTDWLVPIRHVPRAMWGQVLASAEQVAAWAELFGTPEAVDLAFLQSHPTLVVDTRHHPGEFARALLEGLHETVGDIAEATDGLLVHAENYAALRTIAPSLGERVKVVFADPPYNTGNDGFIYKDRYQHATWLTMMEERFHQARALLAEEGSVWVTIDDNEAYNLHAVLDGVFGDNNFVANIAWQKVFAKKNKALISGSHDHLFLYARNKESWSRNLLPRDDSQLGAFKNLDDDPRGRWQSVSFSVQSEDATRRADYRYKIELPSGRETGPPTGRHWNGQRERYEELLADNRIWFGGKGDSRPRVKVFLSEVQAGIVPDTWWSHQETGNNQEAKKEVVALFGDREPFSTPKPSRLLGRLLQIAADGDASDVVDYLSKPKPTRLVERVLQIAADDSDRYVLDFFAGSGTTGDAVIRHVRNGGGRVRFALLEMASYFQDAVHPRIAKLMFAPDWRDGLPTEDPAIEPSLFGGEDALPDWIKRSPRLVKILRLESYDDAMHNLAASADRNGARAEALRGMVGDDSYRLRYLFRLPMDAADTTLNLDKLERPFSYTLETLSDDGPVEVPVDMIETANVVLGVQVARYETWAGPGDRLYLAVSGRRNGQRCLLLWRDLPGVDHVAERDFLLPRIECFDEVLINGANATPGVQTVDPLLFAALEG